MLAEIGGKKMQRMNKNMTNILEQIEQEKSNVITVLPKEMHNLIFPNIQQIHDCIIIDNKNEISEQMVDYDRIIAMHGDKTGYEASCNEVRINDYIQKGDEFDVIRLANIIIEGWKYKLKKEYPQSTFCIGLTCNKGYVTLRFHTCRDTEKGWLLQDLEGYQDEAILEEVF